MSAVLAVLAWTTAEEGRNVIAAMLVVGLVFIAAILLGDLNAWRAHRKQVRRRR
jgi:hypothetical protein